MFEKKIKKILKQSDYKKYIYIFFSILSTCNNDDKRLKKKNEVTHRSRSLR